MTRRLLLSLGACAVALTACSQVAALTPVGGTPITTVRMATYDVLVENEVAILVAPQCQPAGSGFTCTGTTVDGAPIIATASATAPYELVVTVNGSQIFAGNAQDVLRQALEEKQ